MLISFIFSLFLATFIAADVAPTEFTAYVMVNITHSIDATNADLANIDTYLPPVLVQCKLYPFCINNGGLVEDKEIIIGGINSNDEDFTAFTQCVYSGVRSSGLTGLVAVLIGQIVDPVIPCKYLSGFTDYKCDDDAVCGPGATSGGTSLVGSSGSSGGNSGADSSSVSSEGTNDSTQSVSNEISISETLRLTTSQETFDTSTSAAQLTTSAEHTSETSAAVTTTAQQTSVTSASTTTTTVTTTADHTSEAASAIVTVASTTSASSSSANIVTIEFVILLFTTLLVSYNNIL